MTYEIRDLIHGFTSIDAWKRDRVPHPISWRLHHLRVALSCLLALLLLASLVPPAAAEELDYGIPSGRFFKQANGHGGEGPTGFAVYDDSAPFWTEFQQRGGVATLGYPVSRRFLWDGFVVQAFQKAVLQWQPGRGMFFVNVFDALSAAGKDAWLDSVRQTPPSFDNSPDAGLLWDDVVRRHLALLDVNPAIKEMYLADPDPILHYGLPMSFKDYGNVFVVRAQRAVFQQWKIDVPWAREGQVVIANGGDVAKEAGVFPLPATIPQTPANVAIRNLIAGPGTPARLYLVRSEWQDGESGAGKMDLLVSDDLGQSWRPFVGGLPVEADCFRYLTMDHAARDALYATTCRGLYRWTGAAWEQFSSLDALQLAVTYGNPQDLWAVTALPVGVSHSVDGGRSWTGIGAPGDPPQSIALDPREARRLYLLAAYKSWWYSFWRGTGESGQWTKVPLPFEPVAVRGMTLAGATGEVYLVTQHPASLQNQLWRTANPGVLDAREVRWELVREFAPGVWASVLASSSGPGGLVLFGTLELPAGLGVPGSWQGNQWSGGSDPVLVRSFDGGRTWSPLPRSAGVGSST